jgi:hypothetical protein
MLLWLDSSYFSVYHVCKLWQVASCEPFIELSTRTAKRINLMRTLLVCLLLIVATTAFAQLERTTLINTALTNYGIASREDFIVGIGSADKRAPNAYELARERAVKQIFEKLNSRIRNIILASKNRPGGGHQNVAAHYSTVAQEPRVVVELPRIVDIPLQSGAHNSYAIVAVNRQELIDFYTRKAEGLRTEIDAILNDPSLAGNPTYTAKQYLGTYARYEALKEAEMITLSADAHLTAEAIFQTLQQHVTEQHDVIYNVDRYFESQYPVTDIQGVADVISTQIGLQGNSPTARVQLDLFTYDISEEISAFSRSLGSALEQALTVQWATFAPPGPSTPNVHPLGFGRNITSRLSGTFWEIGNKITVRAVLRDVMTGEFQAAAVVKFNKNLRNINVDRYAPPDYQYIVDTLVADAEDALSGSFGNTAVYRSRPPTVDNSTVADRSRSVPPSDQRPPAPSAQPDSQPAQHTRTQQHPDVIETRRYIPYIGSGFTVELRTDRPDGGNYFFIGERTSVYVRVNRPAYFRLGYGFADGRYAILRDNEYIDASKVNTWVKVPGTLVFTDPEGSEYLRVVAQETELPPIQTYTEGKNRFLVLASAHADMRLRGGVGQARANRIALRGAVMEPDVGHSDTSAVDIRGGTMVEEPEEARLTIITEQRW